MNISMRCCALTYPTPGDRAQSTTPTPVLAQSHNGHRARDRQTIAGQRRPRLLGSAGENECGCWAGLRSVRQDGAQVHVARHRGRGVTREGREAALAHRHPFASGPRVREGNRCELGLLRMKRAVGAVARWLAHALKSIAAK